MQDSRFAILAQLLAVKKRKEQRIRLALSKLARREVELLEEERRVEASRHDLQIIWRQRSESAGILGQTAFQKLKVELAGYYQEDQAIAESLQSLKLAKIRLNEEKEEQKQRLHENLIDQEKLEYAMEQEENDHSHR